MEQLSHSTFVADTAKPSQESPSNPSLIIATDSTASHSAPCTSESISSSRPKPNVDTSKPTSVEPAAPSCKLACVMVGLPARGKTYIARKVARYLTWLGHRSRLFNVGAYRRDAIGVAQPSSFFDPSNEDHSRKRMELAMVALDDMLNWLDDDTTSDGVETTGEFACVAMYDATNSTIERRSLIAQRCRERGVDVMFVESICEDEQLIMANIREVKISSPDYKDTDPKKAIEDFQHRIKFYEQTYETLHPSELDNRIAFAKLINVGNQVIVNRIRGYIHSRIVYFLMNLNTTPRSFYFSRHGESMFNVSQRIGGDSDLSWRGAQFAKKLPDIIQQNLGKETQLTIWTSTLRRTQQTAQHLNFPKVQWKQLDEIDSGLCDGLTYAEIELKYPADFAERDTDKFNYRYHGGESYRDLVHRLEPVILELERHHEPNHSILIIGHQAVLRCVYAYFLNISHEELPYIKVPLHTVVKLTPKAYGCEEERFALDIAAVDTHRERPARSTIGTTPGSDKSHGEMPPTSR
ncbi:hypothetical protein BATDEDRAFT_11914 [Batrachochytrium dendrobatidis JAM81]|uniref:fructose-2,6-bisphosphate 2-phosphatase n=1 Tax=Batrachochytrium dendrobatidis (strain JAM81 / FGSC 10211) TaxID=684364 RepID=F4P400_BATDJ|nr:fructose-2,6-bisphosphatase [Batrachochytrium dendrobatidis JAM81]EGF79713.1 hypothetical protein BATDEDRAFT_11914 [Batrachochytrium dendrobatidis JAM81]|eukprot:XP_006679351.1 hypothetical protein BATDEDRAFT_11914 [Batrachochytrium dendrobatidis JAM81]